LDVSVGVVRCTSPSRLAARVAALLQITSIR
jgi:hypothetical protein